MLKKPDLAVTATASRSVLAPAFVARLSDASSGDRQ